jgi:hypothetical protein
MIIFELMSYLPLLRIPTTFISFVKGLLRTYILKKQQDYLLE